MAASNGADVVVIGAGIVGATLAYELARAGVAVQLLDKAGVSSLQSSRNWGFVRRQGCDPTEVPLVHLASQTWDRMADDIGSNLTLVKKGLVGVATSEDGLAKYRNWLQTSGAKEAFDAELVDAATVEKLVPDLTTPVVGGLYTATDGHADPAVAVDEIAKAAQRHGAVVRENVTVHEIETDGDRVRGVVTSDGTISARHVVVSAGAWSSRLLRPLGVKLPVRWIRATAARTNQMATRVTDLAVHLPEVGFSQAADGSVIFGSAAWSDYDIAIDTLGNLRLFLPNFARNRKMIQLHLNAVLGQSLSRRLRRVDRGPQAFEWPRIDSPPPNQRKIEMAHGKLVAAMPSLQGSRIARAWAGTVDVTPDALPVLGPVDGHDGLLLATGMSSHGFGVGPGAAKVTADLITKGEASVDLAPYRIQRFGEGTVRAHHHL